MGYDSRMRLFLFALAGWVIAFAASAQSNRVDTEYASSIFLPEKTAFVPGETTWLAFAQELEPNWHVYWKNPGDSGLPLELNWTLPDGFNAGDVVYPTPERIPVGPLANFGHHGAPVFLVPITVDENVTGADATLNVSATWLICEEICVPETGDFELTMPVADEAENFPLGVIKIKEARSATPTELEGKARFAATAEALVLEVEAPEGIAENVLFFPEKEGLIEPAAEQIVALNGGRLSVMMTPGFDYDPTAVDSLKGVLATTDKPPAGFSLTAEKDASLAPPATASAPVAAVTSDQSNLPILIVAAFFGGMLLNIMPCVFPIIFIKAASLMKSAQSGEAGAIRRDGVLYTAGVVATFILIGGALLALRAGGEQLGWGFHLQSPLVVAMSAYILFLVGLNLSGVFNIGQSLQGAGGGLADKGGAAGAFFTGALAVLVAAPCIGPLLSAPMGAAVLLPPLWGMLIFIFMALGLAAPYLILSFVPALGRMLPKPGPWMKIFKQLLAFPVFAAAAYFLWVLAQQTGGTGLAKALFGAIMLAFAAWLFELSKGDGSRALMIRAGSAVAALAAIFPVVQLETAEASVATGGKHGAFADAVAYDEAAIATFRKEGRPVFVDFTAAWCVTCQFNKLTIFSKPSLAAAFEAENVAVMVADWTSRDPEITKALEAFGANGVPLYVYYPPKGEPQVLPLPITEKAIVNLVSN